MTTMTLEVPSVNLDLIHLGLDAEDYRPTAEEFYAPSDLDEAEWLGMSLRLAGEPMGELFGTNSTSLLLRFAIGQHVGLEIRQAEDRERAAWEAERMEAAFGEPGHGWHDFERIAAVGVIESRRA